MKSLFRQLPLIIFLFLNSITCTREVVQVKEGGGSEIVFGHLVFPDGTPAANTQVMLVETDYNPITGEPIQTSFQTITDQNGKYSFDQVPSDKFNVFAKNNANQKCLLIKNVPADSDTTIIKTDTIKTPGVIAIALPNDAGLQDGFVYIPGTPLSAAIPVDQTHLYLNGVPSGLISTVNFVPKSDTVSKAIRYDVPVFSGDTTIVNLPLWKFSRKILMNTSASGANVSGNLQNFPVLLRLNTGNFDFTSAQHTGADLRFTKPDETPLPYEIEKWDSANGEADLWVKLDTVYGNNGTQFFKMYWGNPAAHTSSRPAEVFDTADGNLCVLHFNQSCNDGTGNQFNGTEFGPRDTAGLIGDAKKFDGNDSIRITGQLTSPQNISLSAWASLETPDSCGSEVISLGDAVLLRMDSTFILGSFFSHQTGIDTARFTSIYADGNYPYSGWHYIVLTIDSAAHRQSLFVDGDLIRDTSITYPIIYSDTAIGPNTIIGTHGIHKKGFNFSGSIDEVRVSKRVLTADWIKLCFVNQKNGNVFLLVK